MSLRISIDANNTPGQTLFSAALLVFILLISGCSTSKDKLLPHGDSSMLDLWQQGATAGADDQQGSTANRRLLDARLMLRRPLEDTSAPLSAGDDGATAASPHSAHDERNKRNEILNQFPRLPNPDLVMYVFPHLAGSDPVPIPGYTTVFPFYQRVQYAMPGERTEAY